MLSPGVSRVLALISLLVGLTALLLPEDALLQLGSLLGFHSHHTDTAKCPLGYGQSAGLAGGGPVTVFVNGSIWTGDPKKPQASTFAVGSDGRFHYVGSAPVFSSAAAAAAHKVVDLGGRHVVPGLVDAHLHLINGGLSLRRLDLRVVQSKGEFVSKVCQAAGGLQPGAWLLGGNWDDSKWGGELPAAAWVDACTQQNPLFLTRMDGHMGLANSGALSIAGVGVGTPDPEGGLIGRDAQGMPTGLLADQAMALVIQRIPPTSLEERRQAFKAAVSHALSKGITSVHDMGRVAFQEGEEAAWEDLEEVYLPAAEAGELPLRLYSFVPLPTWRRMAERVSQLGTSHPGGRLRWGGVKEFADGSLGSHTALMHEPYADNPASSGVRTIDSEKLKALVQAADAANLQVAVHAIGDRAVDEVLDIYASLPPAGPGSASGRTAPRRHRIEHCQHISGLGAAQRLAAAGVLCTPNPLHLLADAAILEARLGPERAGPGRAYAFRTLLEAGATSAFASDWPVVPLEPLGTLQAAVHRGTEARPEGAGSEALSYAQALQAHTAGGAKAGLAEQHVGAIREGMLADFVVLSGSLEAGPVVEQTYVDGACVYGCSTGGHATE